MHNIGIAIHGGAGTILKSQMTSAKELRYRSALSEAVETGYEALMSGRSALDAVEQAIVVLEDCPLFNAGKGSVFNAQGKHEMDASIMDGQTLNAGAIAAVQNLKNPIRLARKVLNHSDHVLLIGEGARNFASQFDMQFETDEYFFDEYRYQQWQNVKGTDNFQLDHSKKDDQYLGTVGAVALDKNGNLAAGTSTGGMTNKKFGRIGDSPIIGAGTYADNKTCAISCTGSGEYIMRAVSAYEVVSLMKYRKLSLEEAAHIAINKSLLNLGGDGGLIGIDYLGNIVMPFNCEGMYRASKKEQRTTIQIYK